MDMLLIKVIAFLVAFSHMVLKSYVKQVSSLFAQFVYTYKEKATNKQSSEQISHRETLGILLDIMCNY
jgi:hypothetical protein